MSTHLKVGDKAPDFEGVDQDGKTIGLKDFQGKKLVLYFYPKTAPQAAPCRPVT